jgi:hypothetical protein
VFSRGADWVTVNRNTMALYLQGVTNWGYGSWGSHWDIVDNTLRHPVTSCGGGIGVLVGDFLAGTLTGNFVARNSIRGRLRVAGDDCGGYNAPGIVLYADYRPGGTGAVLQGNVVTKNSLGLTSATPILGGDPWLVTVSGIELSDTRDDGTIVPAVISGNVVTYNDLRLMEVPVSSNPDELSAANTIANNYTGVPVWLPDRRHARSRGRPSVVVAAPAPIR